MSILDARISVSRFGNDSFVVAAGGELDLHTVDQLRRRLDDVIAAGAHRILVDLTGVSFMDSTTLGVLVEAAQRVRAAHGRVVLVADDPRVTKVIEITGLERVFSVESSLPEGVQALVGAVDGN